jgi:hypothetical protein
VNITKLVPAMARIMELRPELTVHGLSDPREPD